MKRYSLLTILALFWLMAAASVHADEPNADKERVTPWQPAANANHFPVRKLGRGTANFVFGIVEVPKNMIFITKEYGHAAGITYGTYLGVKRFILRELVGVWEVITFWYPQGTIIEPEFVFMPEPPTEWRVPHPDPVY